MLGLRNMVLATMVVSVLVLFAGSAQAGIVNGDFSDTTLTPLGTGAAKMKYGAVNSGWNAKSPIPPATPAQWVITGGQMTQPAKSGSETRSGQVFTAGEMTGTGWTFELDLFAPGAKKADNISVWAGLDDGNNTATQDLMGFGGDGPPEAGRVVGSWTELVDLEDVGAGHITAAITQDLSGFDLIAIKFGSRTTGLAFDNVQFTQQQDAVIPEPSTLVIWALGLLGLGWYGRRRRRAA